jgi:hypothetical protein
MPDLPQAQQSLSFPELSLSTGTSPCATGCSPDVKMFSKSFTESSSETDEPPSADWDARQDRVMAVHNGTTGALDS